MLFPGVIAIATVVAVATTVPADELVRDKADTTGRLEIQCSCRKAGVDLERLPPLAGSSCSIDKTDKPLMIIDRFEGDFALLEYAGQIISLPRQFLPPIAQEGDVLSLSLFIDREKTVRRRRSIEILSDGLFE